MELPLDCPPAFGSRLITVRLSFSCNLPSFGICGAPEPLPEMVPVPVDGEDVDPLAPPGPELPDPDAVPLLADDEEDPEPV